MGLYFSNIISQWIPFRRISLKNWVTSPPPPLSRALSTHMAAEKRLSVAPLLLAEGRPFPTDSFCLGFFLLKTKLQL